MNLQLSVLLVVVIVTLVNGHSVEDKRCKCECPDPAEDQPLGERTGDGDVPPKKCECEIVSYSFGFPKIWRPVLEVCRPCDCTQQNGANVFLKQVVTPFLMVLAFFFVLEIYLKKQPLIMFQQLTNEDDEGTPVDPSQQIGTEALNQVTPDDGKRQLCDELQNVTYDKYTEHNELSELNEGDHTRSPNVPKCGE